MESNTELVGRNSTNNTESTYKREGTNTIKKLPKIKEDPLALYANIIEPASGNKTKRNTYSLHISTPNKASETNHGDFLFVTSNINNVTKNMAGISNQ